MTSPESTAKLKVAMLEALRVTFGIIAHAAKQVGVSRQVHYDWLENDPEYKADVAELKEYKKDFVESKLFKLINEGDVASTIFASKTLLKDRGYVERTEVDATVNLLKVEIVRKNNSFATGSAPSASTESPE